MQVVLKKIEISKNENCFFVESEVVLKKTVLLFVCFC